MIVFADYDNIDSLIKTRGLEYIVRRILAALSQLAIPVQPRIDIRLYGGWFEGARLTKLGQTIAAQIAGNFPLRCTQSWSGQLAPVNVIVNSQIARGLAACEQIALHHTYRKRAFSGRIFFNRQAIQQCGSPTCPMVAVERFISNQGCVESGCAIKQHHVLERAEQKLVDTMLVSDLIYWASRPNRPMLAVLSSDDDMWPGIRTAAALAQPIIQIHTNKSPHHSTYVDRLTKHSYLQTNL